MSQNGSKNILYKHEKRREWGHAVLAWDHGDKRGYQFEDGKLRVFKEGYWSLLVAREAVGREDREMLGALRRRLGWRAQPPETVKKSAAEGIPFERQVALFGEDYPEGFQGARWAKEKRGADTTRRLQRHRDVALVEARKQLCPSALSPLLERGDYRAVVEAMLAVGDITDLVTKAKLKPLTAVSDEGARLVAEAVFDLLHAEDVVSIRFERFVDALVRATRARPSWELATVWLALYHPKEQVVVKPALVRRQASSLGRAVKTPAIPSAPAYERIRAVVQGVETLLREEDHEPRDLLDVFDFMATTLSPKALERIEGMRSPARAEESRAA